MNEMKKYEKGKRHAKCYEVAETIDYDKALAETVSQLPAQNESFEMVPYNSFHEMLLFDKNSEINEGTKSVIMQRFIDTLPVKRSKYDFKSLLYRYKVACDFCAINNFKLINSVAYSFLELTNTEVNDIIAGRLGAPSRLSPSYKTRTGKDPNIEKKKIIHPRSDQTDNYNYNVINTKAFNDNLIKTESNYNSNLYTTTGTETESKQAGGFESQAKADIFRGEFLEVSEKQSANGSRWTYKTPAERKGEPNALKAVTDCGLKYNTNGEHNNLGTYDNCGPYANRDNDNPDPVMRNDNGGSNADQPDFRVKNEENYRELGINSIRGGIDNDVVILLQKIKNECQTSRQTMAVNGEINPVLSMFYDKAIDGWSDQQKIEVTVKKDIEPKMEIEDILSIIDNGDIQ